jgi:hypothetical protein
MSQEVVQNELKAKTQQLIDGPLKHIKAAVLAAALLPLASVAATPAQAQITINKSGGNVATLNANCSSYTLTVSGSGLLQTGSASYTIDITSSPMATISGSFSVSPSDASDPLGYFNGSTSIVVGQTVTSQTAISGTVTVSYGAFSDSAQLAFSGTCVPPPPQQPCDFVTSGGFVLKDDGAMDNFGIHGGCKHNGFWGHVNIVDHDNDYHIDSTQITGYFAPSPGSTIRDICGFARTNAAEAQPVRFRIRLIDNGEPGVADQFGIVMSNGYHVTMRLLNNGNGGGGNVQLHNDNPSTTAPSLYPTEAQMCGGLQMP